MSSDPDFSPRREIAVGLGTYAVYLAVRAAIVNDRGRRAALRNARRVVALERRLGIHFEPQLQRASLPRKRALVAANLSYVTLNVGLTVGWLRPAASRASPTRSAKRASTSTPAGWHSSTTRWRPCRASTWPTPR
jgi:hypothetical protein